MATRLQVLAVSGSLRSGSTNAAAVNTAAAVAPDGIEITVFDRLGELPHFNPDDDGDRLDPVVAELRSAIATADAIVFSTPEYAGALPGSFKNLLDWTVGGMEIHGKPVGWINASSTSGAKGAHAELRTVLGYVEADIVDAACADIAVLRSAIGTDGTITDPEVRSSIADVVEILARHVHRVG